MTGIIKRTTENYNLRIPIFDAPGWGREVERNFDILDAVTYAISGFTAVRGIWTNGTLYKVGDRVVDQDSNTVWRCLVEHTSSVTGTFSDERTANPTYWEVISSSMVTRGAWQPNTDYKANEIVTYDNKVAIVVVQDYTSSASFDQDVTDNKLAVLIDLNPQLDAAQQSADDSANSADASANSASAAHTSELNAATSEQSASDYADNASTSETNAATSASNAHTSELNAAASASAAATSETNAATSETNAHNSEVQAGTYTSQAQAARDQTLAALDQFDDRYLGEKVSDPSTDNDGEPLVAGALYFNTVDGVMKVYTGTAWVSAYVYGGDFYLKTEADARFYSVNGGNINGSITATGNIRTDENFVFAPNDYWTYDRQYDILYFIQGGEQRMFINNNYFSSLVKHYFQKGTTYGSQVVTDPSDLSKHLALWGTNFGFSITDGTLNLVSGAGVYAFNGTSMKLPSGKAVADVEGTNATGTWPVSITGNAATADNADNASNADKLGNQAPSYYTDIVSRLGYTPLNKAGDTIYGPNASLLFRRTNDANRDQITFQNAAGEICFEFHLNNNEDRVWFYAKNGNALIFELDGHVSIIQNPTGGYHAVPKAYVDARSIQWSAGVVEFGAVDAYGNGTLDLPNNYVLAGLRHVGPNNAVFYLRGVAQKIWPG